MWFATFSKEKNVVSESYGVWFSACHDTIQLEGGEKMRCVNVLRPIRIVQMCLILARV